MQVLFLTMDSPAEQFREWIHHHTDKKPREILDYFCHFMTSSFSTYDWVGIYILKGDKLILASFSGDDTEHKEIKIGDGLCSLAILRDKTVNEPNVKGNTEYLACFPTTESELVVPIRSNGKAVGEIDIDSDTPSAFSIDDEKEIEMLSTILSSTVSQLVD